MAAKWLIPMVLAAFGAVALPAVLSVRLGWVPPEWWQGRDDAVITLSHAQNLVLFGSVGVSPGGDRVEGFSSPLQFLVAAAVFAVAQIGYQAFFDLQFLVCLGMSGALTASILHRVALRHGFPVKQAAWLSAALTVMVAALIASCWTVTGWLASGMENPLALVLGLAVARLVLVDGRPTASRAVVIGVCLCLLGLVRIEFPAVMLPLLGAVVADTAIRTDRTARPVILGWLLGVPAVLWGSYQVGRVAYFGQLLPNTALAQGKGFGGRQLLLLVLLPLLFAGAVWFLVRFRDRPRMVGGFWLVGAVLPLGALARGLALGRLPGSGFVQLSMLFLGALGVAMFLNRGVSANVIDAVFAGLVFMPIAQFLLMGPARLDPYRVVSLSVPWILVWIACKILGALRPRADGQRVGPVAWVTVSAVIIGLIGAAYLVSQREGKPSFLCCKISPSEDQILEVARAFKKGRLNDRSLSIVANPDLGKISFKKEAMMVDLGFLGDPLLTRINAHRKDLMVSFMTEVATPDVIELHYNWLCTYRPWIETAEFQARWELVTPDLPNPMEHAEGAFDNPSCFRNGRYTIWTRADADEEYGLTRMIAVSPDPIAAVRTAVERCAASGSGPFRCEYVRRAVQRNAQGLRERGLLTAAADALGSAPSGALDRQLLLRKAGWAEAAFKEFQALAER